jgi:thiol-disulfide isomerase/thioredoxin
MARIRAPEFPQAFWLNTDRPLSLKALKGRIVLLDFWTYCCINCLHILPDLKYLEQKYADCLTIIGIHSAKFDNEKDVEQIRQAILRYDIEHPVLVDNEFQAWQQYAIRAWPTLILIDPMGYIVGQVSGEGKRDLLDELIGKIQQEYSAETTLPELNLLLEKQQQPVLSPLAFPGKVLADAESNLLFIADSGHHRIVVAALNGEVQAVIGSGVAGWQDGSFSEAQFFSPQGMTFDRLTQLLYVADTENHVIRRIDLSQKRVETIAGTGTQSRQIHPHNGTALETALNSPWDLVKIESFLFIAMAGSHQIWALDLTDGLIGTYTGTGAEACLDGSLNEATFAQPSGLATDGEELFIADSEGSTIRAVGLEDAATVRSICGSGELFGFGDEDGQGVSVRLQHCLGVAHSNPHQLWIADTYNHKIKQVDIRSGICQTVFGDGIPSRQDGQATDTRFNEPAGLSQAGTDLYVADTNNHAIRKINLETLMVETLTFPSLCAPGFCILN